VLFHKIKRSTGYKFQIKALLCVQASKQQQSMNTEVGQNSRCHVVVQFFICGKLSLDFFDTFISNVFEDRRELSFTGIVIRYLRTVVSQSICKPIRFGFNHERSKRQYFVCRLVWLQSVNKVRYAQTN